MRAGSYLLRSWVEQVLRTGEPGSGIPSDRQLAAEFGLTDRTVRAVLRTYRDRGELVRLPGRGTFLPVREPSPRLIPVSKSSPDGLADALYHSIVQGSIQRGQPLPQIKFTSRQFRVSPATVIAAYRRLVHRGVVTRIGKAYWVGTTGEILQKRQTKKVYLFNYESDDFSDIFRHRSITRTFEKLEKELASCGYSILFENTSNLGNILADWKKGNGPQWGLIFAAIDAGRYRALQPVLASFLHGISSVGTRGVPVLIDWSDYTTSEEPRGVHMMRREHVITSTSTELVNYFRETGLRSAHLFLGLSGPTLVYEPEDCVMLFFKLRKEVKLLDPGFRLECTLVVEGENGLAERIRRRLPERISKAEPYTGVAAETLRAEIAVMNDIGTGLCQSGGFDVGIFSKDEYALTSLEWARRRGLRVPKKLSLISLQNDPAYLHAGITYCGPDWERIGYAMAHTIIQDIPLDTSTHGYLRTWAHMLHRLTTKA